MNFIKRLLAGAAGLVVSTLGVAVAGAYVTAMLASVPSLGALAQLTGSPSGLGMLTAGTERNGAGFRLSARDGILMVTPRDRLQLQSHFAALGYFLDGEEGAKGQPRPEVPRVYLRSLPRDLAAGESAQARKQDFVRVMLPLILAGNEKILADRHRVQKFAGQVQGGGNLYAVNKAWLVQLAAEYGLDGFDPETGDWDELLRRVDAVPPSLALAQAALESGWGTSRFAQQGNAVFGQWSWKPGSGLTPVGRHRDADHEVRRFTQLSESVSAYLLNLNTHAHYNKFRYRRAAAQAGGQAASGMELAKYLDRYSEDGLKYIDDVRALIEKNLLLEMDAARLRPGV